MTIPANAAAPVLLRYAERTHGAADNADYRETLLLSSSYGYVARLARSAAAGDGAWSERVFDVTAYRGRVLVIYFNVYNDGAGSQMWSYLDDIELGSCVGVSSPNDPTPAATPEATATPSISPTLAFSPSQIYLGELFGADTVTVTVRLGSARSGFGWEATTDAPWLHLSPIVHAEGDVLRVSVAAGLSDGVYTATIRSLVKSAPEQISEAPVFYMRGAVQPLYLPAILNDPPAE